MARKKETAEPVKIYRPKLNLTFVKRCTSSKVVCTGSDTAGRCEMLKDDRYMLLSNVVFLSVGC